MKFDRLETLFRPLMVGLVVLAIARPLAAQTQEREERGGGETGTRANFWELHFWGQQLWESNARLAEQAGDGDLASRAGMSLGRGWRGERGGFGIGTQADVSRYQRDTDLTQFSYLLRTEGSRRLTRRLSGTASYQFSSLQSREVTTAQVTGPAILLPLTRLRTHAAAGGVTYRLTRSLEGRFAANYDEVSFDSDELAGGKSISPRMSLAYATGGLGTFSSTYTYSNYEAQGLRGDSHALFGTWERPFGRTFAARADGGAVAVRQLGGASDAVTVNPTGGVELRRNTEHDVLALRFDRAASQAFGFGRVLIHNQASTSYSRQLLSLLNATVRATYLHSTDPDGPFTQTSQHYEFDMLYQVTRQWQITGGPFYRQFFVDEHVSDFGFGMMVSYGRQIR